MSRFSPSFPDLSEGFMQVPHFITDTLITQRLSSCQWSIVQLLMRMTFGFQRDEAHLAEKFIAQKTEFSPTMISRSLGGLMRRSIVTRTEMYGAGKAAYYKLNINVDEWKKKKKKSK